MSAPAAGALEANQRVPETRKRFSTILILTWVFTLMSIAGLVLETMEHFVAFNGEWERRAGFIWGPFSPIYGSAAGLLTLLALKLDKKDIHSSIAIFLIAALVGGALEYFASWAMETFWGIVAWSYLDAPLNFDGRTDVIHMVIWGLLGLAWVKLGWPAVKRVFAKINMSNRVFRAITWVLLVFLLCDACMTIAVMMRADARTHGVAATTSIEETLDAYYPNEVLQARFENMGGIGRAD